MEPKEGYESQLPPPAEPLEPGDGILAFVGWADDGYIHGNKRVFRAIIEFPHGPPDLPVSVVWNNSPVRVILKPPGPWKEPT